MFIARIRFLLVIVFLGLAVWLHVVEGIGASWYLYLAGFLLLLTHFLTSNVSAAFMLLRGGDLDKAEQLIDQVKKPEWLLKRHRAYYHFTKGMIAAQRNAIPQAKQHLSEALKIGLRTPTDNALAAINLSNFAFQAKDHSEARKYLDKAKNYNTSDLIIKEHIERIEGALG